MKAKIKKSDVLDIYELNMTQQGILFHYLREASQNLYNVQLALDIEGPLDTGLLRQAFEMVQAGNEALRSVFSWETGKPLQIILKHCALRYRTKDLSDKKPNAAAALCHKYILRDQAERFDLDSVPLRITVLRLTGRSHVLVITHHHILYDGWSTGILLKEVFHYYYQLQKGLDPQLPAKQGLKDAYKAAKQDRNNVEAEKYWRNYLREYEGGGAFPAAGNGAAEGGEVGKYKITAALDGIDRFSKQHKVTKAALLYAAYGILLQQYGDISDTLFGITVAHRDPAVRDSDKLIGNFINTIPLRIRSQGQESLQEIVEGINRDLLQNRQYSGTSYFEIKQWLDLKPGEDLFDSVMVIENYPLDDSFTGEEKDLRIGLKGVYEHSGIPLMITVFFKEDLEIEFACQTDRVSLSFVQELANRFLRLLEEIVAHPEKRLLSVDLLTEVERDRLLQDFNDTHIPYSREEAIGNLFEKQAAETPGRVALVFHDQSLSYGELNGKVNTLAATLRGKGIGPGKVVAIHTTRSFELYIAMLAVLKAGGCYLPLDPTYPPDRLQWMIADSGAVLILVNESLEAPIRKEGHGPEMIRINADGLKETPENQPGVNTGEDLAYVIYTSGSTGRPKGVMLPHRAVHNYIVSMMKATGFSKESSIVSVTTFSFDIFITESLLPLTQGMKVVIADEEAQKDPWLLSELIRREGIDIIQTTPSRYKALAADPENIRRSPVRYFLVGGEPFPEELLYQLQANEEARIFNVYGPTETTVWSSLKEVTTDNVLNIGKPIGNTQLYILGRQLRLRPIGMTGELYIGGEGLALGYLNDKERTDQAFIADPFHPDRKIYRTGDLARWLENGEVAYAGRVDAQIKIRGHRVEPGEIESHLREVKGIKDVVVVPGSGAGAGSLIAYYVKEGETGDIKRYLSGKVPDYMMPAYFVPIDRIPLTPNGKIDRKSLPDPSQASAPSSAAYSGAIEEALLKVWGEVLGTDWKKIGADRNFFDTGGDSLKLITVSAKLRKIIPGRVTVTDLLNHPTISSLAAFVSGPAEISSPAALRQGVASSPEIAVIGMAGRFPGAMNIKAFWNNLREGRDTISRKEPENGHSRLVIAKGMLEENDMFDAAFFDYLPSEAATMDPQMRVFHECVWEALEDAGYPPHSYPGPIGLYGGASPNPYFDIRLQGGNNGDWMEKWDELTYADKDFLCPRVSYKLNLKGPSLSISTACSTSLVAVDIACNELLAGKCDIAVAGGVSISQHDNEGYFYQPGMILSSDGRCRAFDEQSSGTVGGNGVGVVVLKRLDKAIADGDFIHAVLKGTATNNDGNRKVGFTAPSVEGQSKAIRDAIQKAGVDPGQITYVETHGTGTSLGDPVEIAGLTQAFGVDKKQYCAVGSVKTNIGHLDAAAGIAGLIKTVLAIRNREIPPSLHFTRPNPHIDFAGSPFYVNHSLSKWESRPRIAGVSSFGIGGTNAHVIVGEAPEMPDIPSSQAVNLLVLSARTLRSLQGNIERLAEHLGEDNHGSLEDIAFTLQTGRTHFPYRAAVVCRDRAEAIARLSETIVRLSEAAVQPSAARAGRKLVFMFSGQGSQYAGMYRGLYQEEASFRHIADECFDIISELSGEDMRKVVFPENDTEMSGDLTDTRFAQPVLFVLEYTLARWLIGRGIKPDIMIGHSIGEYVAACISGVMTIADALLLVVRRGELMQKAARGSMLGVLVAVGELAELLDGHKEVCLAAVNSPEHCVVSGTTEGIGKFKKGVEEKGYRSVDLHTSHAFHSFMMDEILQEFGAVASGISFHTRKIPYLSNLTGEEAPELIQPRYWVEHLRREVKFADSIGKILQEDGAVFVELGPGNALATFVRSHKNRKEDHAIINLVRNVKDRSDDVSYLMKGIGAIWVNGIEPDWKAFYPGGKRRKVSLPAYFFDKASFPVVNTHSFPAVPAQESATRSDAVTLSRNSDISQWFYTPSWKALPQVFPEKRKDRAGYLLFVGEDVTGRLLQERLRTAGEDMIIVSKGRYYKEAADNRYTVDPASPTDYEKLFRSLSGKGRYDHIIYAWELPERQGAAEPHGEDGFSFDGIVSGCHQLVQLVKSAYAAGVLAGRHITLLTQDCCLVSGEERLSPAGAPLYGLMKVMAQEFPGLSTGQIDISSRQSGDADFIDVLYAEIDRPEAGKVIAIRNSRRWQQTFELFDIRDSGRGPVVRENGVYLVTGGLGNAGFHLALYLLKQFNARLVLVGRKPEAVMAGTDRMHALRAAGGEVLYLAGDVTDPGAMAAIVQKATDRFGSIQGVIHAAGTVRLQQPIDTLDKDMLEAQFGAKVKGIQVLEKIFAGKRPDFLLVTSSISSILGGVGMGAYTAANSYLDQFIQCIKQRNPSASWVSVNLDGLNLDNGPGQGINAREFPFMLEKLFSLCHLPQLVVSLADLDKRISSDAGLSDAGLPEAGLPERPGGTAEKLVRIWQSFLGIPAIRIHDNFFAAGGDSMKALLLMARINKAFNSSLAVSELFNYPTIGELAALLDKDLSGEAAAGLQEDPSDPSPIPTVPDKPFYRLSSTQRRLYFLHEFDKHSTAYNMPMALRLEGKLDKTRLTAAFTRLIDRHEVLRTRFETENGVPVQKVAASVDFEVGRHHIPEGGVGAFIPYLIRPFDLTRAPLMRVELIETGRDRHVLVVDMHHIVNDGISRGVLINEFMTFYNGEELPALPLQYRDYAEWQQQEKEGMATQKQFWVTELAGELPVLSLPYDLPRPAIKNYDGGSLAFALTKEEIDSVQRIAEKEGATLFVFFLSVFNILLGKLSGQRDIIVGTTVAGRDRESLQKMIGMFVNTLALRNIPGDDLPFRDFLNLVKQKTIKAFDNQNYPYEDLIDELKVERNTGNNPLFDVLFSYENYREEVLRLPDLQIQVFDFEHPYSKFDLSLVIREGDGVFRFSFEYSASLFHEPTIERLAGYFKKIIAEIIEDPAVHLKDIEMLSDGERQLLLTGFNDTACDIPENDTIVSLFEAQAKREPDKVALEYENIRLTYKELNEQADRIAILLQDIYKVKPNELVGIMMGRSEKMLIGLLGILKSGAAYLPIDPAYPRTRIEYILSDSGAPLLIADRHPDEELAYSGNFFHLRGEVMAAGRKPVVKQVNSPDDLCYVMYTSGSTGLPKGVKISHRNVVNFFYGMSQKLPAGKEGRMLAVTSPSFDISVLELFWTLCHGTGVVIHPSDIALGGLDRYLKEEELSMDFSLFFFSSYNNEGDDKYALVKESVEYADREGFTAVWTPERHFHEFGGLFPNPSVLSAALAMSTKRIGIRSGSVVLPLHDEIRVAEEWSVVDNLSGGRVALSFASGWNPNDFVLLEGGFTDRQKNMYEKIDLVRKLWRGESIQRENGFGKIMDLRIYPEPLQKDLPIWVTSGGTAETFTRAGEIGANLLTHLLGQDLDELKKRIRLYREARERSGFAPGEGKVAIMLHTYIGEDIEEVERVVEQPFIEYLKSSLGLSKVLYEEGGEDQENLPEEVRAQLLKNAFKRYYTTSALIGTKRSCMPMLQKLKELGVDEIACLVDFGMDKEKVMEGLRYLNDLKNACSGQLTGGGSPITMMQSTPSFVSLLEKDPGSGNFLRSLDLLLLGGEAMPHSLLSSLRKRTKAALFNMYGPTETTIWSCVYAFGEDTGKISIGKPIINTQIYILDKAFRLVPMGVTGDLYIGGKGLSSGYWNRDQLTRERFIDNPYRQGEKIYRTGDVARWMQDGNIEYLGREDYQVKISGHRIELGEVESALLKHPAVSDAVVVAREEDGLKTLTGYVTGEAGLDAAVLGEYLSASLPHYMIPEKFMLMKAFPLTPNGKVDRKALPEVVGAQHAFELPANDKERLLADVWARVLGVEHVGAADNFFSLGGDSIKSIQITSRMRSEGYELSVKDIFISQTIRQLALKLKENRIVSDQSLVTGPGQLTPIQRWYFEGVTEDPHHYNQSVMLNYPRGIKIEAVRRIFEMIQLHHDALRMVFRITKDGALQETRGSDLPVAIIEQDLRMEKDPASALLYHSNLVQGSIDLEKGPLMKLGLFHLNDGSRLLIAIHHLVVDGISWRILFEDIEMLYRQIMNGQPLALPLKTASFRSWPDQLLAYTRSREYLEAKKYWKSVSFARSGRIRRDNPQGANTGKSSVTKTFTLNAGETARLLTETHTAFGTGVNDIMLTALSMAIYRRFGVDRIITDLEGHGREDIGAKADISRTVGWFTSIYRVLLEAGGDGLAGALKRTKEMIRKMPNNGIDYLLIKYLDEEASIGMDLPGAQLSFNYLGQFDSDTTGNSFLIAKEPVGDLISGNAGWIYDWDIVGFVGSGELTMRLRYSHEQYDPETIGQFMQAYKNSLLELIDFCCTRTEPVLTPSDLTYKGLSIAELDAIGLPVRDIYPLSPTQEGILYHSLLEKDSGDFHIQISCRCSGDLDVGAIERSMNWLVMRYDVLRTVFLHEGYDRHLQLVLKEHRIDFRYEDVRGEGGPVEEKVQRCRLAERNRPFDLSRDVLIRVIVLRTGEQEYWLIWNYHHLLMDGWCMGILVGEFRTIYAAMVKGEEVRLAAARPYGQYIEWLEAQDKEAAVSYWKEYLSGYNSLSGIPRRESPIGEGYSLRRYEISLDEEHTRQLYALSGKYGVTINTIFQCAWGLLLSRYNNVQDVVFGSVVSGRPAEMEGVERMVGLFINTIPVRIRYEEGDRVLDLLQAIQEGGLESPHYYALSEIQSLSELGTGLLDHIMAFENFPVVRQIEGAQGNEEELFGISQTEFFVQTNYDLEITVFPVERFGVRFDFNVNVHEEEMIRQVAGHLNHILEGIAKDPEGLVSGISLYSEAEGDILGSELRAELEDAVKPVQELLEESFRRHGDRCAVRYKGKEYRYGEIEAHARALGRRLPASAEGSCVGVFCEDRQWLISSILGILGNRSAFVPLETTLPKSRLSSMIRQAGIRYILTDQPAERRSGLEGEIEWIVVGAAHGGKNGSLNGLNGAQHEGQIAGSRKDYSPEDLLYVYFTSGSTGNPKGVAGRNKGLSHFVQWEIATFGIDASWRFSQFTNPGFDAFMRDMFVPLCAGGTICVPDVEPAEIGGWIDREKINLIHCVPSFFRLFGRNGLKEGMYGSLKYILLAGEKILPYELQEWYRAFGDRIQLVNLYGATETTLVKGYCLIDRYSHKNYIPVKAMKGAQFWVMDRHLHVSPRGAVGEIYIRTPYRTSGYLDAGANARSFLVNPYSRDAKDLLYRTGDLGRQHAGGEIEIIGRQDQQVKVRGIRVELDDIRENMLRYGGVREAVVVVREDREGDKTICGYYVGSSGGKVTEPGLRQYLEANLPGVMVPSWLIGLEKMPLLPNGKIDRKSLPEPGAMKAEGYVAAEGELERRLVDIWAEVLKIDKEKISTTSSFVELGGHSLTLLLLINKINVQFNVSVPLRVIFEKKSIKNLADYITTVKPVELEPAENMLIKEITI